MERSDAPASPDSVHVSAFGNVDDEIDIGVVVVVGAAGNLNVLVGHANVLGIDRQVFRSGHDNKLNGALEAKCFVGPFADGADLFDGGDSVVADEHTGDDRMAAVLADKVGHRRGRRSVYGVPA